MNRTRGRTAVCGVLLVALGACSTAGSTAVEPTTKAPATSPTTTSADTVAAGTLERTLACLHGHGLAVGVTDADPSRLDRQSLRVQVSQAPQATRDAVRTCLTNITDGARTTPGITASRAPRPVRDPDQPVFDGDFADPSAIIADKAVYAVATNTPLANVPVGKSTGTNHTTLDGDALPKLAAWSEPGFVWAPAVSALGPNDFRMYYATRDRSSGRQCVSVASATSPGGPYVDKSTAPLVCPLDLGGAIDPSPIKSGGASYLLWRNDGNCCGLPTTIWSTPLSPDGLRVAGPATALIRNDQTWEGTVVEAPSMVEHDGRYFLFYSGNAWDSRQYATGYAVCRTVRGPCAKPLDRPWLDRDSQISGPGGLSVFLGPAGESYCVYHAWLGDKIGYDHGGSRVLFVTRLTWKDGAPVAPDETGSSS